MAIDPGFFVWLTVSKAAGWVYQQNKETGERRAIADQGADRSKLDRAWLNGGRVLA